MTRSRTVFPGSLVDGLLSDLAAEQRAAPELAGQLELDLSLIHISEPTRLV